MTGTSRQIRLTLVPSGDSVVADLLDDEAPDTVAHIWSRLPVEGHAFHGQYSGAEVFVLVPQPTRLRPENLVHLALPGELFYFFQGTENAVADRDPIEEIVFVYGRGVRLKQAEGVPTHGSLFARVPGDWKHDWTAFADRCRSVREFPQRLRIDRVMTGP